MTAKTLQGQIEELVSSLGGAKPPTNPAIRGKLLKFARLAKALEKGQSASKKEARIADFEAQFENLQIELQAAKSEIQRLRDEQKKQQERQQELPDTQFEILKRLPLVNEKGNTLDVIARTANIPLDEAEIHLHALCKARLAQKHYGWPDASKSAWRRTMAGNKHVVAKRMAGEEGEQNTHKHPDLPEMQFKTLLLIAGHGGSPGAVDEGAGISENEIARRLGVSLLLTQRNLRLLRAANLATDGDEPQATYGAGQNWWLLPNGEEFLAEREFL